MKAPGLLHTSAVHVPAFDELLSRVLPGVQARHVVDETLLADARRFGPERVIDRIAEQIDRLVQDGAGAVCCTCSTVGQAAESVTAPIPVFRVDRPMATLAVHAGERIGVVAALDSTLEPTTALLREEAQRTGAQVSIDTVLATGAWECFERSDHDGYLTEVARTARDLATRVDVVVLAQASMAAAYYLLLDLAVPVLSSPGPAVQHLVGLHHA